MLFQAQLMRQRKAHLHLRLAAMSLTGSDAPRDWYPVYSFFCKNNQPFIEKGLPS